MDSKYTFVPTWDIDNESAEFTIYHHYTSPTDLKTHEEKMVRAYISLPLEYPKRVEPFLIAHAKREAGELELCHINGGWCSFGTESGRLTFDIHKECSMTVYIPPSLSDAVIEFIRRLV